MDKPGEKEIYSKKGKFLKFMAGHWNPSLMICFIGPKEPNLGDFSFL